MLELSQEEKYIIARYPLGDSLDFLRLRLPTTEQPTDGSPTDLPQAAVSLLLTALMGQKAAYNLTSRTGGGRLASTLLNLLTRVHTGPFNPDSFLPLSLLVIDFHLASNVELKTNGFLFS